MLPLPVGSTRPRIFDFAFWDGGVRGGGLAEGTVWGKGGARAVEPRADGARAWVLCEVLSRANHSCSPNLHVTLDAARGQRAAAVALCDVAAGDELCLSYLDAAAGSRGLDASTEERRAALRRRYRFHCCCARCGPLDEQARATLPRSERDALCTRIGVTRASHVRGRRARTTSCSSASVIRWTRKCFRTWRRSTMARWRRRCERTRWNPHASERHFATVGVANAYRE